MDLAVCRGCLAMDVRLFSLNELQLWSTYEQFVLSSPVHSESIPDTLCTLCCELLKKLATFVTRCQKAEKVLIAAVTQIEVSPQQYIKNLDCDQTNFTFLTQTDTLTTDINEDDKTLYKIKKEAEAELKKKEVLEKEFVSVGVKEEFDDSDDSGSDREQNDDNEAGEKVKEQDKLLSEFTDLVLLSKEQQRAELEARKLTNNYIHSPNRCELCFKGFVSVDTYEKHMKYHDVSAGPHKCSICGFRRQTLRKLKNHQAIHTRRFKCRMCDHVAISSDAAKKHIRWHQGVVYKCKFCDATFTKKTTQYTHLRLQHPTSASCSQCGQAFLGLRGLELHRKRAHGGGQANKAHECPECKLGFRSAAALRTHSDDGCDSKACPCVYCGKSFPKQMDLRRHLTTHELKENPLKCSKCSAEFTSRSGFREHGARAHRDRDCPVRVRPGPTICELCGQTCKNATQLKVHHRIHTGEKPFQCAACPKTFRTKELLILHKRTHSGERPYKCTDCDKAFRDKAALNRHERTHLDVRPHACPHCDKAFKDKGALDRHDRTHTGFRPHSCAHCGKSFSQSNSLKLHVRTVHLKLPSPYKKHKATNV